MPSPEVPNTNSRHVLECNSEIRGLCGENAKIVTAVLQTYPGVAILIAQ